MEMVQIEACVKAALFNSFICQCKIGILLVIHVLKLLICLYTLSHCAVKSLCFCTMACMLLFVRTVV